MSTLSRRSQMAATTKMNLKLLVNKNSRKVLFAEAGKDLVDFLFELLRLPICSIMALLIRHGKTSSGSLASVYKSAKDLDNSYLLQDHQNKDFLLRPMAASSSTIHTPLLQQLAFGKQEVFGTSSSTTTTTSFLFGTSSSSTTTTSFSCNTSTPANSDQLDGYVKSVVTYMVMEDLVIKPMSTISSITLLNTFEVKDVGCLQEMTVEVDMEKDLELVKASFQSTTVLSDVFLSKNQLMFLSPERNSNQLQSDGPTFKLKGRA